jgi:hypothetical protein
LGIEGPWLDTSQLTIQQSEFRYADLTQPFAIGRTFDLAISLEVAEHIDEFYADTFVSSLCNLSPRVVFSAAVPYQGGAHHVNEQWQSYWGTKFSEHDYMAFDIIRPMVWNEKEIPTFFRQNTIIYLHSSQIKRYPALSRFQVTELGLPDRVHPDQYLFHVKTPMNVSYRQLLRYFPAATIAALGRTTRRIIGR